MIKIYQIKIKKMVYLKMFINITIYKSRIFAPSKYRNNYKALVSKFGVNYELLIY